MAQSPLRILHVASEAVPFVKTGGLADVVGALPTALAGHGHDVRVVIPGYRSALKVAETANENDVIVFIVCDTGERYLSKFLSDEWMKEKRLLGFERLTVGLLNEMKGTGKIPRLIYASSDHKVAEALHLMNAHGLSQIPIIDEGNSVGSLREGRLMSKLLNNRDLLQTSVSEVMDAPFPVVNETVEAERATKYLKHSPAILVEEYGRIVGIITRHDVIDVQA